MKVARLEQELPGKSIIITGGNKGIGLGCAKAFCEYGANVVITARDGAVGRREAQRLTESTAGLCEFLPCDVSREEQVKVMVQAARERFGRIDCLINNAGFLPLRRPLDLCEGKDVEDVLGTNVMGMFYACKYALPHLRHTHGSIINMSSVLARAGQEGSSLYTATKGAIVSFTKSLSIDEARNGVRVNAVLPGAISTGLEENEIYHNGRFKKPLPSGYQPQWIERYGEPEEVGTVCLFLASSWASYVNGAEIYVDGGFMLGNGDKLKMFDWEKAQKIAD